MVLDHQGGAVMVLLPNGLTVHQASMSDSKFRLCIVLCVLMVLKSLNSISYVVPLFSVLQADSKIGTQHEH